jgi:toxin ParE1/3/4
MAEQIAIRPQAQFDIADLASYLNRHSARVADRFLCECEATFQLLLTSPEIGSLYPTSAPRHQGIRVFPVREFPNHVVFYFSKEAGIEIVRVVHGARDLNAALEEA